MFNMRLASYVKYKAFRYIRPSGVQVRFYNVASMKRYVIGDTFVTGTLWFQEVRNLIYVTQTYLETYQLRNFSRILSELCYLHISKYVREINITTLKIVDRTYTLIESNWDIYMQETSTS